MSSSLLMSLPLINVQVTVFGVGQKLVRVSFDQYISIVGSGESAIQLILLLFVPEYIPHMRWPGTRYFQPCHLKMEFSMWMLWRVHSIWIPLRISLRSYLAGWILTMPTHTRRSLSSCLIIVKYTRGPRLYRSFLIGMYGSAHLCPYSYITKGHAIRLPPTIFPRLQSNRACFLLNESLVQEEYWDGCCCVGPWSGGPAALHQNGIHCNGWQDGRMV